MPRVVRSIAALDSASDGRELLGRVVGGLLLVQPELRQHSAATATATVAGLDLCLLVVAVALGMHREGLASEPPGDGRDLLADTTGVLDDREDREARSDDDREVVGLPVQGVLDE